MTARWEFELLKKAREIGLEGEYLPLVVILTNGNADLRVLVPKEFDMECFQDILGLTKTLEQIDTRPDQSQEPS